MKRKHNNIETIFKDKLQELEVTVPEHLWDTISEEITPKKDRKKVVLLWYFSGGIAASLLLFATLLFNSSSHKNNNTIITTLTEDYCPNEPLVNVHKNKESIKSIENSNFSKEHLTIEINAKQQITQNNIKSTKESPNHKTMLANTINSHANTISSAEVKQNSSLNNTKNTTLETDKEISETKPIFKEDNELLDSELLALLQKENNEPIKKGKTKKWSIQPQLTTFSYSSNGSSINSNFKNNPQNTETDLSYGMRIAYQATPKISVRTGINNANINITTSNIGIETSLNNPISNLFTNNDVSVINLNPNNDTNELSSPVTNDGLDNNDDLNSITSGQISQQIQYFEIPLELTYKALDKKIGIDVIGGFSTFILSKNKTTFESINTNTSLGETSSINDTSFSSNIGFSVNYLLIKNLKFSIEPMLKFQFNSFDNNTNNQPYFIGLSSGLKWNF